jgi:aspartyl-tRNA(Asn)/glutamyl-tRNA(Gln) amidotransferase subunit A
MPLTLEHAAAELRSGNVTSVELTRAALARADQLDDSIGVYLARFDEQALTRAGEADLELSEGVDLGPLHGIPGIPLAVKDILAAKEGPTTAQSSVPDPNRWPGVDATAVRRLREAGAVITGKTTTAEFACGLPDPSKPFPLPNPWDLRAYPGGSSSGSGSGVASGMFYAALGTDTAGSVRIPAAWCGVSGLKPTFGRVSKAGCIPLAYTLDNIGVLARSAWDCAAVFQAIAGPDPRDPDTLDSPAFSSLPDHRGSLKGIRIGVDLRPELFALADGRLRSLIDDALSALSGLGAEVTEIRLPRWDELQFATILVLTAEAAAYHRPDMQRCWDAYFAGTRQLLAHGALVTGMDYVQAQRVRRVAQTELSELYRQVDLLALPTTATSAFFYDEQGSLGELDKMVATTFTPYWDGVGNPVLALPIGMGAEGLPLSMQLATRPFEEQLLFDVADAYQGVSSWHLAVPPEGHESLQPPGAQRYEATETRNQELASVLERWLVLLGVRPGEAELTDLAEKFRAYRTGVDALYGMCQELDVGPAVSFRANAK